MNISAAEQARNGIRDLLSQNRALTYKPLDFSCLLKTKMSTVYNALSLMRAKKEIREFKKEGHLVFSWKPDRLVKQINVIRDNVGDDGKNTIEEARLRIENRFNELKAKRASTDAISNTDKINQTFDEIVELYEKKSLTSKKNNKKIKQTYSSPTRDAVFECIREGVLDIHSIAKKIGKSRENVRSAIQRTLKDGTLYRVRSGVYDFVENKGADEASDLVQVENEAPSFEGKRLFTVIEFDKDGTLLVSGPFDNCSEASRYYWERKANGAINARLHSDCEVELNVKFPS